MTEQIKELEEAREGIHSILFPYAKYKDLARYEMIDQILNLKGVGWSIEVVKWELDSDTGASHAEIIDK